MNLGKEANPLSVKEPLRIAVLASGRGTNLQAIIDAIAEGRLSGRVVAVISDNPHARALERARIAKIPARVIEPSRYASKAEYESALAQCCLEHQAQVVALAGYMRILGAAFLERFPQRVVNIHPSLLPSFPGLKAQEQAIRYGVRYSGCTVHFVDEGVDSGPIILQAVVPVLPDDTEKSLSERILVQEHRIYPRALQLIAEGRLLVEGRRVYFTDLERSGHGCET